MLHDHPVSVVQQDVLLGMWMQTRVARNHVKAEARLASAVQTMRRIGAGPFNFQPDRGRGAHRRDGRSSDGVRVRKVSTHAQLAAQRRAFKNMVWSKGNGSTRP